MPIKRTPIINIDTKKYMMNIHPRKPKQPVCPHCQTNIYKDYGYVEYGMSAYEYGEYTKAGNFETSGSETYDPPNFTCPECGGTLSSQQTHILLHL
jgi:hypothetical protein